MVPSEDAAAFHAPEFSSMDQLTQQAVRRMITAGHSTDLACLLDFVQHEMHQLAQENGTEVIAELDMVTECILPSMNQMGRMLPRWIHPLDSAPITNLQGRYDHRATHFSDTNQLVVYGGMTPGMKPASVNVLETNTWDWWAPVEKGTAPSVVSGQAVVGCQRVLLVFGGRGPTDELSNGLWTLDIDSWQWRHVRASGDVPSPREGHTLTSVEHDWYCQFVLFGGADGMTCFNSVHTMDSDDIGCWKEWPSLAGKPPVARQGHATAAIRNGVVVFGGHNMKMKFFHDIHVLNTEMGQWHRVPTIGSPVWGKGAVFRHMEVVGDRHLVICSHDGFSEPVVYSVNLDKGHREWSKPILCGAVPAPRFGHSMTNLGGSRMLFFGGCTDQVTYRDVTVLDLHIPWLLERWLWKGQRSAVGGCKLSALSRKLLARVIAQICWVES